MDTRSDTDIRYRYECKYTCMYRDGQRYRYSYRYIYTRHCSNHKELAPNTFAGTYT